ncbi:TPA: DUF551 domain-containing protein [Klebsiella oxytoca]|nr:DUF551 domain-containing protein [Klebsiella oxytoca]
MTKSTITDERVTSVIERLEHYACNLKWTNARGAQDLLTAADGLRELQERRKAAVDSEPVAWTWHYREQWHVTNDKCRAEFVAKDGDVAVLPLYRHAQQPVVMDDLSIFEAAIEECKTCDSIDEHAWNHGVLAVMAKYDACRAAMLHAGTLTNEGTIQAVNSPVIPEWVPVSERMPENKPGCYEYLVFETLNNRVNHDYWNVPDKGDDAFAPFWNYYGEHVTHWMPLPAAPQEVKGD